MFTRRLALAAVPVAAVITGATAGLASSANAASASASAVANGRCTGTSSYSLQVQREDNHMISVDWGVDMKSHVSGIKWTVQVTDNGKSVVHGTFKTIGDGSFSVTRQVAPQATNSFIASAHNPATGETCTAKATL